MDALATRVTTIVGSQLGVEMKALAPEASLLDDLGADSLDVVELVMALEEEFGLEISDEDAEKLVSVKQAIEYIDGHVKA